MHDGPPVTDNAAAGETPPCLSCGKPSTWTSPTGHPFCDTCRNTFADLFPDTGLQPVDLAALMSGERPEEDWMVEPLLPAGKLVGIVSKRGDGKSILLLDMAAARAIGKATLLQAAGEPVNVVYVDMEMGPDDLYDRLESLGYLPNHPNFQTLIDHLHYYQLVALPPLNTEEGGQALEELVDRHAATLVVIDTVSRVVTGDENTAEPYRDLFRHTETRLKRRRVTLARLDHLGKDTGRGSRGSSAKEDPLDVVWQLEETAVKGTLDLTLTKGRQPWIPRHVTIHREERGELTTHTLHEDIAPGWLVELAAFVDSLGLGPDVTVTATQKALREAGRGKSRKAVTEVVRFRKGRKNGSEPSNPPNGNRDENRQNQQTEILTNIEETGRTDTATVLELSQNQVPPLKGGTVQTRDPEDDFEPDWDDLVDTF